MNTKVIPCNYIDDLEETMQKESCMAVGIEQMSITYVQPADTCSRPDDIQTLTITTQCDASVDKNEEGFYYNLSIPHNQHWSVDDGDSLKALIEDFKKRLYMTTEYKPENKQ